LWGDPAGARIVDIAFFCDSDDTGGETVAYFADVRVTQKTLTSREQEFD